MRESAVILGKTQRQIENEYYLVDLPELLDDKRRTDAIQRLADNHAQVANNGRRLEDEDYKEYRNALVRAAGIKPKETFDRDKFEQLRMMAGNGANKKS
ncbi:hypothetical protein [Alteribacter populi]|uniref:hypothetical protein n=1 Tax=Alteribacter populi TaxID=2011011 RepID=UPI000BBB1EBA|nr:hypothetical protein [Alteribacter populi]